MFGFIELEDDPAVAKALIDAATGWLRAKGRKRMIGPMDFTTNDECGLLVEGYDREPIVLAPWHPPYYKQRLEELGLSKSMDLLMWELWLGELQEGNEFHPMIEAAAKKSDEAGVVIRGMRKSDLENEITRFMEVYNEAWGPNWGFVPVTAEEVAFQAKNLKPILSEDWAMIAERGDEVVGAGLTLPDINQVLKKMNGRLFPFGWWHFLTGRRKIDRVRVFALGVKTVLPAPRRCGGAVRAPSRDRRTDASEGRRDGLDPGDQRAHEPRHGGHGREGRRALPALRARALEPVLVGRAVAAIQALQRAIAAKRPPHRPHQGGWQGAPGAGDRVSPARH